MQIQEQQNEQRDRGPSKFVWIIIVVALILITLSVSFMIVIIKFLGLNSGLTVASIAYDIFTTVFLIATFILGYFQWLTANRLRLYRQATIVSPPRNPQGILGVPAPVNPITTIQRENMVNAVYAKLTQPRATAVVLTGIFGCGKSTLASLVCEYAEKQHKTNQELFTGQPIWIEVCQDTIFADIVVTLFNELGKDTPDLENLSVQNQALRVLRALNEIVTAQVRWGLAKSHENQ